MRKRRLNLVLIATLAIASVLATGCKSKKDSDDGKTEVTTTASDTDASTEDITTEEPKVEIIKVKKSSIDLKVGDTEVIEVETKPTADADVELTWKSNNEKVAKVSKKGEIKAEGKGTCTITVCLKDDPSIKAQVKVSVKEEATTEDDASHQYSHSTTEAHNNNNHNNNNNNNTTQAPTTQAQTTQAPSTTEAPQNPPSAQGSYNYAYCEQVLALVNELRASLGVAPLTMNYTIQVATDIRAKEIEYCWSHDRPDGSSCFTALNAVGVPYGYAGENIAYGQSSPQQVFESWKNSQGHYDNMVNSNFHQIGISCYYDPNSDIAGWGGCYWVQLFTD